MHGEHTREVLREAGYGDGAIEALLRERVVTSTLALARRWTAGHQRFAASGGARTAADGNCATRAYSGSS